MPLKKGSKQVKKSAPVKKVAEPVYEEPDNEIEEEIVEEAPVKTSTKLKKPEEFKATKTTKSMTWQQKVNVAKSDLAEAKKNGFSFNSVLSSRLKAASSGIKSVSESSLTTKRFWYKTPLLPLDYAFSKGKGIPAGAVIEFYGPEMGGKTTALLAVAGILQARYDAMVVIADTEASIDDSTMERAHLMQDSDHLMALEAPAGHVMTFSFVFNNFTKIIEQYATSVAGMSKDDRDNAPPLVLVWDSLGGTSATDVELDDASGAAGGRQIGKEALDVGLNMKKLKGIIRRNNVVFLVCNQQRAVINMTGRPNYGDTEKPAGGHNWQHETDVRFRVRHYNPWGKSFADGSTRIVTKNDDILGNIMYFENRKNKVSAPFRVGAMLNIFDMGVDITQSNVIHAAFDLEDSCLKYAPGKKLQGIFQWRDFTGTLPQLIGLLRDDEDLQLQFEEDIRAVQMKALTPSLPPPEDLDEDSMETDEDMEGED